MGYLVPDEAGFGVEGYEYMLQERPLPDGKWEFVSTNKHSETVPYPTDFGPRISEAHQRKWRKRHNAQAVVKGREPYYPEYEYRAVKRPYGEWEVVDG